MRRPRLLPWAQKNMSHNYRFYASKMEELRVCREIDRPLVSQLHELFLFVEECETRWERSSGQASEESGDA